MERSTYYKIAAVVGATVLATGAFTRPVRQQIIERDGGKCVICGSTSHLEAAHIDHNKANPRYNDTSNGRVLCVDDHLKDHVNRHGRNGLPKSQNEWAIKRLLERVTATVDSE